MPDRSMVNNVQVLRFVATLLVTLYHFENYHVIIWPKPSANILLHFGWVSVDIFFVVSGAVITLTTQRLGGFGNAVDFLCRRIVRVYPTYWIALAIFAAATAFAYPEMLHERDLVGSVLLLPTTGLWLLGVAWTLPYEIMFYLFATLVICFASRFRTLCYTAAVALILVAVWFGIDDTMISNIHTSYFIEILAGGLLIKLCDRTNGSFGYIAILFGLVALVVMVAAEMHAGRLFVVGFERVVAGGLPAMAIVYGCIAIEARHGVSAPSWLARTGEWAYSLYLLHMLVPHCFFVLHLTVIYSLPITLAYIASAGIFIGTVAVAAVFAEYVDIPIYRRLKRVRISWLGPRLRALFAPAWTVRKPVAETVGP